MSDLNFWTNEMATFFFMHDITLLEQCHLWCWKGARGVTIRVPHHTIRISIQRSRYNMYLDTYLNRVGCQRDVMSSMKAETPVIRSPAHNLLLQWMEYLLLQLLMLSQDVPLLSYIRVFPSIWSEKNYVFQLVSFKNTCAYSFLWIAIHWVCRIDTNHSDKISMHRDAPVNRYTPKRGTLWNALSDQ